MRVLMISHTCQSSTEGQPKAVHLGRRGDIDLTVLSPTRWKHYGRWRDAEPAPPDAPFRQELQPVRWPWIGPAQFYLHHYPALGKLLTELQPDVIDLWEEPWALVSAQAAWLRRRLVPHAKLISETEQNLDKKLPFPFERMRRYTLGQADFLIGRSREAVEIAKRKGYDGPSAALPNAVDEALFRPMDRAACREELGLVRFTVGYVGRLVPEKGLSDLLDAVAQAGPDIGALVVGRGPMRDELHRRVAEQGLAGRVRLIDHLPLDGLPTVMNAIDALALPSRTTARWKEQFGRVVVEAQACRTPVIGSDSGAIPEVVGDGGVVVPERDPATLAKAIRHLADDPALTRRLGQLGFEQVHARYTWRRLTDRMAAIYHDVTRREPTDHADGWSPAVASRPA
ncbi:MAG: glycosyltransferase [Planctomycetota bacterium]